jgi:hypothetical protein
VAFDRLDRVSPQIDTLTAIAEPLKIDFKELFEIDHEASGIAYTVLGKSDSAIPSDIAGTTGWRQPPQNRGAQTPGASSSGSMAPGRYWRCFLRRHCTPDVMVGRVVEAPLNELVPVLRTEINFVTLVMNCSKRKRLSVPSRHTRAIDALVNHLALGSLTLSVLSDRAGQHRS